MMVWLYLQVALCCGMFVIRKRIGFLLYQLGTAFAYLLALTMVQELDYTMSIYYAFSLLPYIRHFRLGGLIQLLLAFYLGCDALISIVSNGIFPVASSLIVHFVGPLVLLYVFSHLTKEQIFGSESSGSNPEFTLKAFLFLVALGETVIGLIAISQSVDGRLMLNYQCVSGCLACTGIVLTAFLLEKGRSVFFSFAVVFYLAAWAIASGTRGYIVLAIVLSVFVLSRYKNIRIQVIMGCLIAAIACVVLVVYWDEVQSLVMRGMRFGESTGRRGHENIWFINLFFDQGIVKDLFGIGIGTTYSTQVGAEAAWSGIGESAYTHLVVMNANFLHNFWFMSVLAIGLVGTLLYVAVFIQFAASVKKKISRRGFTLLLVFMLTYAFVLWFRWTATGGMFESAVLAALILLYQDESERGVSGREKCLGN